METGGRTQPTPGGWGAAWGMSGPPAHRYNCIAISNNSYKFHWQKLSNCMPIKPVTISIFACISFMVDWYLQIPKGMPKGKNRFSQTRKEISIHYARCRYGFIYIFSQIIAEKPKWFQCFRLTYYGWNFLMSALECHLFFCNS